MCGQWTGRSFEFHSSAVSQTCHFDWSSPGKSADIPAICETGETFSSAPPEELFKDENPPILLGGAQKISEAFELRFMFFLSPCSHLGLTTTLICEEFQITMP